MRIVILAIEYYDNGNIYEYSRKFRLCDLDTQQIKVVTQDELIEAMKQGLEIENLNYDTNNGTINLDYGAVMYKNSDGKMNRGYKYYIAESKDNEHVLIDYNGKRHIVDNSVINKLKETELINPLDCNMPVDIKDYSKRTSKYTGEVLSDKYNKLIYAYKYNIQKEKVTLGLVEFKMVGNKLFIAREQGELSQDLMIKGIRNENGIAVYEDNTLIVGNALLKANENNALMAKLLSSDYLRAEIDKSIYNMKVERNGKSARKNKELDMLLPTKTNPYKPIVLFDKILKSSGYTTDINIIRLYAKKLSVMGNDIMVEIPTKKGRLALSRNVTDINIVYKTLGWKDKQILKTSQQTYLEDIFNTHEEYANVVVKDNIMIIYGIDGAYRYDMDKIYESYQNKALFNKKNVKAQVLGLDYKEKVTESGVLVELITDSKTVTIPENVKVIDTRSIKLAKTVEEITFGKNIELMRGKALFISDMIANLKVNIDNDNRKVRESIIRNIQSVYGHINQLEIKVNGDLTERDLLNMLILYDINSLKLTANNFNTQEEKDKLIESAFNLLIKSKYKTLSKLGDRENYERTDKDYYVYPYVVNIKTLDDIYCIYKTDIEQFIRLLKFASDEVRNKIESIIKKLEVKIMGEIKLYDTRNK